MHVVMYTSLLVQPHYKESALYLARFKQHLARALSIIKESVVNTLKATTNDVRLKQVSER